MSIAPLMPVYPRCGVRPVEGDHCHLIDEDGTRYLDFASGIAVNGDPFTATVEVCRRTAANISSMLQDVRRRRRTEIDAINGTVVRVGQTLGLETPENLRLVQQIRAIEAEYAATL